MLKINDIAFPGVGIAELQRGEQKDYKYDLTAEDGTRRAEVRARYRTYSVTLGSITQADYDRLYAALATNAESVSVTLDVYKRQTGSTGRPWPVRCLTWARVGRHAGWNAPVPAMYSSRGQTPQNTKFNVN